jgi:pyruvate dehydrogenase E1 component beta subunit
MNAETTMAPENAVKAAKANILQGINAAIADAMEEDDNVIALGEDLADPEEGGVCGVTRGLSSRFGEHRVRSTPISEQAIIGAAIGASLVGFKPIAEIMLMNFTTVAMDMIVNHAAKLRFMSGGQTHVPIVIRTMTGTGFASGGQHCDYLEAWFAHTAGIKVVAPSSPKDAYGLMRSAIDDPDPVLFIENLPTYWTPAEAPEKGHRVPIGKANVLSEGSDVTIIAYARMIQEAMLAVAKLKEAGISAELIDLRTIAPWDKETVVNSVARTGRAIIVHEAVTPFGAGAEIAAVLNEELFGKLKAPVKRLGGAFCPVPFSKPLETAFAPQTADIVAAAEAIIKS